MAQDRRWRERKDWEDAVRRARMAGRDPEQGSHDWGQRGSPRDPGFGRGREEWSAGRSGGREADFGSRGYEHSPRGFGGGQDETGWSQRHPARDRVTSPRTWQDQSQDPSRARDREREQSARSGWDEDRWSAERDRARDYHGSRGEYGGADRGLSYADRGDRSSAWRERGGGDWGMGWRHGSGREYDQYTGMLSEPGFGSGYGAAGPRRFGGEYAGRRFDSEEPHGPRTQERGEWGGQTHEGERGFWDKASDEVSSWFGDDEASRRREEDRRHAGRGPRNYARSDSRIHEDVCDRLTDDPALDASEIEVAVSEREVTLSGFVHSRADKRRAEDCADVAGVKHVQNNLRIHSYADHHGGAFTTAGEGSSAKPASSAAETKTTTGASPGVMTSGGVGAAASEPGGTRGAGETGGSRGR